MENNIFVKIKNKCAAVPKAIQERLNRRKISQKMTLAYSGITFLILALFTVSTILSVYIYTVLQSRNVLNKTADKVVSSLVKKEDIFQNDWDSLTDGNDLHVVIYSENGEILSQPAAINKDLIEDAELKIFGKVFHGNLLFDDAAYINKKATADGEVFIVQG